MGIKLWKSAVPLYGDPREFFSWLFRESEMTPRFHNRIVKRKTKYPTEINNLNVQNDKLKIEKKNDKN